MDPHEAFFDALASQYWAAADDMIAPALQESLYRACRQEWDASHFHEARIGRQHSSSLAPAIRGDSICWLSPGQASPAADNFLLWADALRLDLNRQFYAGLNSAEFHFARYSEGRGYKKHLDQHQNNPQRRISLVLYLNRQWASADGGELCLYSPDDSGREIQRILPQPGRLVLFRSDLIPHEVLPCGQARWSLTGWFRNDRP
ncbi:2OG-Fe(II) oxygenase [Pollutimonas bauzanensis]|uniref:SM-20-related protein n=1 Tax=Pollutimonas bauzanensis TaxID=658167 RepID=A0A1M5Y593_9BURK|nr:2OG-Fe(II) oxygenase [Pollutimonas bauzanensis]SHI07241.1 SM-20-related protein [Pollutimonas bauzanensis]